MMHVEGISAVDTVSHKAQMFLRVQLLQVLRPPPVAEQAVWDGATMENGGLLDNLSSQAAEADKAPSVCPPARFQDDII